MKAVANLKNLFAASMYVSMVGDCVLRPSCFFDNFLTIFSGFMRTRAICFQRERQESGMGWNATATG
jgi:hypothetical protein